MESSQTPPPGGGPAETPPPAAPAPPPAAAPPGGDERAGAGPRIGSLLLALVLAIIAAVAIVVVVDVGNTGTCEEAVVPSVGTYECYDFSESVKPVVVVAGWIGGVLTAIAALMALAFTIRGRGGRAMLMTTAAAVVFLGISIVAAQLG